mgnify:CR=1 FL=1|tara:strand:- start:401 stop:817 length:417 start_codon:yes stop_codon:yes gene_type:complete
MITVFHAKKFGDNTQGYVKVAEVNVNSIGEAFHLTQNLNGSWSREAEFVYDGETVVNEDYSDLIKITADLPVNKKTGNVMGLRSTSSGDVLFDGDKHWFLVPLGPRHYKELYKTHGQTLPIDNFDIDGFVYADEEGVQ